MKKLMLLLTACCIIFASCGKKAQPAEQVDNQACCELTAEEQAMCETWKNWDNLTLEEKGQIVADVKAWVDAKIAGCKEKVEAEGCPKKKEECEAKHAEFMAQWEQFDTLTLDEQKALIDEFFAQKCCKEEKEENIEE